VERRKTEQETRRLLYVATTRARRKLHLLATIKTKEDGSLAEPMSGSFLKLLWPVVAAEFAGVAHVASVEESKKDRTIRRLPVDWRVPAAPPAIEWTRHEIGRIESAPLTFEWVGEAARHAGTALHGLLQRVAREGLDAWDERAVRSRHALYQSLLANFGVPPDDLADAVKRVEGALLGMLRDPKGRWILSRHSDDECELPLTGTIAGKLYTAVIDRTFVDDKGVRWIIDYKTGSHEGGDVERFLDREMDRYREQLERYARLMMQRDHRPVRLGLYFPLLGGWREWDAPVAMHGQASLFEW
jgi:ATP-dependent exoDNAse (exonuclease V) beta subunit